MNIIKRTTYFPGFILCHVLLACCLMMARCTVESMIHGYYQYISKLSFESELDLLKCCKYRYPYLDPYAKQIKANFTLLRAPHVTKQQYWRKKVGELLWFAKFAKIFYCTVYSNCIWNCSRNTCQFQVAYSYAAGITSENNFGNSYK